MNGLGAGIANSWIESYTQQPAPCVTGYPTGSIQNGSAGNGTLSTCLVWLVVGLVVGSVIKGDKR